MSKKQLTIWFDKNGNLLTQGYENTYNQHTSELAEDFHDSMQFLRIQEYHKKNTRIILRSVKSGRHYSMFVDDFNDAHFLNKFIDYHLTGTWRFIKKGTGQAVRLVLSSAEEEHLKEFKRSNQTFYY